MGKRLMPLSSATSISGLPSARRGFGLEGVRCERTLETDICCTLLSAGLPIRSRPEPYDDAVQHHTVWDYDLFVVGIL
jgi:hypothetical protein